MTIFKFFEYIFNDFIFIFYYVFDLFFLFIV